MPSPNTQSSQATYAVDANMTCGGKAYRVVSVSLSWGVNEIPTARVLTPIKYMMDGVDLKNYVVRGSDFSKGLNPYFPLSDLKTSGSANSCDLEIEVSRLDGDGPYGVQISLSGWRVIDVSMEAQTRTSPGGVWVTIAHPISRLLSSPGFFYVGSAKFNEELEDNVLNAGNVVEVADGTLNAIASALAESDQQTENKSGGSDTSVEGENERIGNWVDIGDISSFPYVHLFGDISDVAEEACKLCLSSYFLNMTASAPYHAFVTMLKSVGAYLSITPVDEKATVKVSNPWARDEEAINIESSHVAYTSIRPDSDPICGIRLRGASPSDAVVISSLQDRRKLSKTESDTSVIGDTMYYYSSTGKIINTDIPQFAKRMLGEAAIRKKKKDEEGTSSQQESSDDDDDGVSVPSDEFKPELFDALTDDSSADGESSEDILKKMYDVTAESLFATEYMRTSTMQVSVVPDGDIGTYKPGSFVTVSAGTGGQSLTGTLVHADLTVSSKNGTCLFTVSCSHVGEPPDNGDGPPMNKIWSE